MGYRGETRENGVGALARCLGWFSIALGGAELLAPRMLGRALGMEDKAGILQAYGLREIATGVGILASPDPIPWIWGRVAGDVLDVATLMPGLGGHNPRRETVGAAIAMVAAVTLVDVYCAQRLGAAPLQSTRRPGAGAHLQ